MASGSTLQNIQEKLNSRRRTHPLHIHVMLACAIEATMLTFFSMLAVEKTVESMQEIMHSSLRRVENRLIAMDKVCLLNPFRNKPFYSIYKCPQNSTLFQLGITYLATWHFSAGSEWSGDERVYCQVR
jgi:hypothetical protein